MVPMVTTRARLIGRSPWTSALQKKKLSFKLLSSIGTSVDVSCAVVRNTSAQRVRYANSVRNGKAVTPPPLTRNLVRSGKTYPVGAGRPTGEELGPVDPLGRREDQGLALRDFVEVSTKHEFKPGLVVVAATVKGSYKPCSIFNCLKGVVQLCSTPFLIRKSAVC